jgi:hypothetical protein
LTRLSGAQEQGKHVLYFHGNLKGLAAPTTLAKMLSYRLLSIVAADLKHLYFKGTVSEDFLLQVFFMNHLFLK